MKRIQARRGEALQCAHANLNYIAAARRTSRGREMAAAQSQRASGTQGRDAHSQFNGAALAVTARPIWVCGSAPPDYTDSFGAGLLIPLSLTRLIKMDL